MEDFLEELKPFLKEGVTVSIDKEEWQREGAAVITYGNNTLRFSIEGGDELGAWFNIS